MDNQKIDNLIVNRMANEIGTLKARNIQVETYNEVLVERIKELEAKLEPTKNTEGSEADED